MKETNTITLHQLTDLHNKHTHTERERKEWMVRMKDEVEGVVCVVRDVLMC
jgi:hypothetical protein